MNDQQANKLVSELARKLSEQNKTLAVAESCTGGWLSKTLTDLQGSSEWFLGSVVSYSNFAKCKLLHVDNSLINEYGAVSKQVVESMAEGVQREFSSTLALSITGIAGPAGGTDDKPVGLVWFAITSSPKNVKSVSYSFEGGRDNVRRQAVVKGLQLLIKLADE